MTPEQTLAHLHKLDRIVAALKFNPLAPRIRIFGSALHKDVPGDIDVFYEGPSGLGRDDRTAALDAYLRLAVEGGYTGNYGCMDPFVLDKDGVLFTRNSFYGARTDWERCHRGTMRSMIDAGRAGTPILAFDRNFAAEWLTAQEILECRP